MGEIRESSLLRGIVDRLEAEGPGVDPRRVAEAVGMSQEDADRAARRLYDAGMLRAMLGDDRVMSIHEVTEKGLRAAGDWPGNAEQMMQALLAALDEAADKEPDSQERSKIEVAKSALAGLSLNTLSGVASALVVQLLGGS